MKGKLHKMRPKWQKNVYFEPKSGKCNKSSKNRWQNSQIKNEGIIENIEV
jgi:hypothetical protein